MATALLSDNVPFIFECFMTYKTPSCTKKHRESTELESRQMAKLFFFLLFFFFRCILHWALHQPITFHNLLKSHEAVQTEAVQTGHWRTMASLVTPFLHLHTCAQIITNIIQDFWIRNTVVCMKMGESLSSIIDSAQPASGQWLFSQYCIYLLRKPMRTGLLLCDRW